MNDDQLSRDELLLELRRGRERIADLEHTGVRVQSSEALFGGLLEAAPDSFVIVDATGTVRLVNPQAERMFGYSEGELIGQPIEVLVPDSARAAHARQRTTYSEQPASRRMGIGLQLSARRKDGSEFPAEISLSPLQTPEGRMIISAIRDVSERREVERQLQRQAEALAASNDQLQQFAYVASHDLQEPLRMVSSYLQLLSRRYTGKLDADADEFIGFAVDGAKRMQALIQDLLAYSRVGSGGQAFTQVDLNDTLARVQRDLKMAIDESGADLQVERLPVIVGQLTYVVQLFENLVGNAIKFRRPGQKPHIQVRAKRLASGWQIAVQDDGIGLEPQYAERIFQIFQRLHTRQEYPGTGIGLAICKRIMDQHGGEIRVQSQSGSGATFLLDFPDRRAS